MVELTRQTIELYALNDNNRLITKDYILRILNNYDVECKEDELDIQIFIMATTHPSYTNFTKNLNSERIRSQYSYITDEEITPIQNREGILELRNESYERIEFLGDAVLRLVLTDILDERYPDKDEGFMTKLRAEMEKKEKLFELCKVIGLNTYILISYYIECKDGRQNDKDILEDVFEAFIGALYRTIGYERTYIFIRNLYEREVDVAAILRKNNNYKEQLIVAYHKLSWSDPKYTSISQTGSDRREFIVSVKDDLNNIIGTGNGSVKKMAEQAAAKMALKKLGFLEDSDAESDLESVSDDEYFSD